MIRFSSREAAKRLGIGNETLANYIRKGKLPAPETVQQGQRLAHSWSEQDIERVRELLPKIANGRKTRHTRKPPAKSKTKKPQPRAAVPHKNKKK